MGAVEDAIAYVEAEQAQARTFAIEIFNKANEYGVKPSLEADGAFYVNTEILSVVAQATATSAILLSAQGETKASNAVGKVAQIIDALSREAKGTSNADVKKAAERLIEELGL